MFSYINLRKNIDIETFGYSHSSYYICSENHEKRREKGTDSPLFLYRKMNQEKVHTLLNEAVEENDSLFVISVDFLPGNKIKVIVDGDKGVPLSECVRISRNIEHNLDREEEDFSLEVSSPDITQPLIVERQYQKNIGRILKVKTAEEQLEGTLTQVSNQKIELKWKAREPKPIGKGKVTVEKQATLLIKDIIEAKVKIIF